MVNPLLSSIKNPVGDTEPQFEWKMIPIWVKCDESDEEENWRVTGRKKQKSSKKENKAQGGKKNAKLGKSKDISMADAPLENESPTQRAEQWMLTKEQINWVQIKLQKDAIKVKKAQHERRAEERRQQKLKAKNKEDGEDSVTETEDIDGENPDKDSGMEGFQDITVDQVV